MDLIKIGKYVKQKRKEVGLTQEGLAEKLGITDRAVSKWEICGARTAISSRIRRKYFLRKTICRTRPKLNRNGKERSTPFAKTRRGSFFYCFDTLSGRLFSDFSYLKTYLPYVVMIERTKE